MKEDYTQRFATAESAREYDALYYAGGNVYSKVIFEVEKTILSKLVGSLPPEAASGTYLDFATGTGRILNFLEGHFQEAQGIDISEQMLTICSERVKKAKLRCGDITAEPVDQSYELITAFRFFLNAGPELRGRIMLALSRRLTKKGRIILNNHGRPWSMNALGAAARFLGLQSKQQIMSDAAFERLLDESGLKIERKICYGLLGGRLTRLLGFQRAFSAENSVVGGLLANTLGTCAVYLVRKADGSP